MTDNMIHQEPLDNQTLGAFSLSDLWESVYRRKWLVIGITFLFSLFAYFYTETTEEIYYAEAKISLEQQERNIDMDAVLNAVSMDTSFIATEIEILNSRSLISAVVELLHPDLILNETSDEDIIRRHNNKIGYIISRLDVSQIGKSRAIKVGFSSPNAEYASKVANAVSYVYIEQQITNRFDIVSTTTQWLQNRVTELREKVRETDTLVVEYRKRENIVDSRGVDIIEQDILELSSKLIEAKTELNRAEARLSEIPEDGDMSNSPTVLNSPTIQGLQQREAAARSAIASLSREYGPAHPEMMSARAELGSIRSKINQEMDNIAASLQTSYAVAQANVERIQEEISRLKTDYDKYKNSSVELQALEREAEANRELLETLNARLKETQAQEDRSLQAPNARIISEATIPSYPIKPKKKLIWAAAIVAGLGLSIACCIGVDQFQTGAYNGRQLQNLTGVTNISLVPRSKLDPGRGINRLADYPIKEPYAVYTESIRSISMFIRLQLAKDPKNKIFNFTSCLGNEGKSSVVSSLSRQMSLEGLRVLAIDCDMRKPRLGRTFGVNPEFGFHDLLNGDKTLPDVIMHDEETGLDYICAGRLQDVNIISRRIKQWEKIMKIAQENYDVILLDSPPILFVADTKLIAKVSQNILCVQSRKTPMKLIGYAVDMFKRLEVNLLGTVITMASSQNKYLYEYEEEPKDV